MLPAKSQQAHSSALLLFLSLSLSPPLAAARSHRAPGKVLEALGSQEMRRGGGGGEAASLAALLCCGCVMLALAGAAAAQGPRLPSAYKTLSGDAPRIVAKGGFSGVFPDSSSAAYSFALSASAPDTTLWCDVQLTKDGVGVCLRDINMQNCTNVAQAYTARKRTYVIDGVRKTGWFASDFTMAELQSVVLTQAIWSRSPRFDGYPILSVTDLPTILDVKQPSVWLNVQHDIFYKEHGLNMRNYILSIQKNVSVHYISSPELGFLQNISGRVHRKTKLVFSFLDKALLDNSIHRTYGSLLSNLTFVKSIASGIMVPKSYIWPVTKDNYLQQAPTSIVAEAHSAGLEIYASDFANDRIIPYNYSYDPLAEYLNFISDGGFSVDGVLSEHPITASGAIGCFANLNSSKTDHGEPLIISHNGASGDYPDCTDLAYHSAINDGADVIDCPVQVTSDGTLMCMSSVNLLDTTNVQRTPFSSRASVVSEIQATPGVFTFNLTWDDINSSIQPKISSPLSRYYVVRNPRYTNQGKFLKLSDFLAMGMDKDLSGVMIIIENAAFLAKSLGIDIVDSVNAALNAAGYDNQTAKGVLIQSKDSAVLVKLKQQKTKCKLVYTLPSGIGDVSTSSLEAVKKFADAVVVDKDNSVFTSSLDFIIRQNNLMKDLQSSGLAVYAQVFRNEFLSQPLDFFSDETVEINYYFQSFNLSGIITDFPKTVRRYKKNTCTGLGNDMPNYMQAVPIGALDQLLQKFKAQPPSMPPMPTLNASDVVETPLPPVAPRNEPGGSPRGAETPGLSIGLGVGGGISLLLALGTPFLIHKIKLQRAKKRRENFFNQNHGLLLQQLVSHNADIGERMIITLRELEKATNNFDRARVIGGGGHGVVFKGMIDLKVVAIKKSRILVQREIDEFINEVAVLSQVNHRNVVKLLGCCLETEVPLLVYEFISNGTLYQHLHVQGPVSLPRADRIRIALEVARALSYLHSAASMPIFHRDIKSANILLDDSLVAKVSDFGASRYIPIDKTGITTAVQGTIGYLDPEYYYTGRLTDKSDVFSFGVLLVELLTRKKPFVYRTDDGDGLVSHFVSLLTEGKLVDLIDPQIIEDEDGEVYEVAILAAMCTKLRREDRPTMREAEMRLENLLVKKNQIPYIMAPRGYNEHNTLVHCMSIEKVNKEASRQYTMEDEIILSATYPR